MHEQEIWPEQVAEYGFAIPKDLLKGNLFGILILPILGIREMYGKFKRIKPTYNRLR